jgi:hypothetical protein
MKVEKELTMDRERVAREVRLLRDELAEAWWNEAPYEKIEHLEKEIAAKTRQMKADLCGK